METTETVKTAKEILKEDVKAQTELVQKRANDFKSNMDKQEKLWRDYFEDIKKHSDKFQLVVTPKVEHFNVSVYPINEDGSKVKYRTIGDNLFVLSNNNQWVPTGKKTKK